MESENKEYLYIFHTVSIWETASVYFDLKHVKSVSFLQSGKVLVTMNSKSPASPLIQWSHMTIDLSTGNVIKNRYM